MKRLFKLGLTGGIAAGKLTVATRWREAGADTIETDELAHRTLTRERRRMTRSSERSEAAC